MSLTFAQTQGNGVTLSYPITLQGGYFTPDDIVVEFIDVATGEITEQSDTTYSIETGFVIFQTAPTSDVYVRIRRKVALENTYSSFNRGNDFGKDNINNSFLNVLYQLQQLADGFLPDDFYLKYNLNAGSKRIVRLLDGEDDQDAATVSQLNTRLATNATYLEDTEAAQAAAELAQSLAEAAQAAAELAESNVATLTAAIDSLELSPEDLATLQSSVEGFSADLATTNTNVSTNTSNIATNTSDIATNTTAVALNTAHRTNTSNPHNVTQEQIGYTASDVLAKLKTVDSDHSGLNANTLQGRVAEEFQYASTAFDGTVHLKGTRTSSGTWTLSGLTVGKPLYLGLRDESGADGRHVKFRVVSGAYIANGSINSVLFSMRASSSENSSNPGGVATIPYSTTVSIYLEFNPDVTVYAYQ
jgi:hypothetical protein